MRTLGNRLLLLWKKYERHINLGGLALGFTFDLWLAKRPDSVADNILLIVYLIIVGTVIILLNSKARRQMEREHPTEPLLLLLVLQFCFGGLANNMLILYGKSGTLGGSFLFVLLLGAFALGNEFLKGRYEQLRFNIAIYYFLLLTYCIIAVPTFLLHAIGTEQFLLSCLVSIICIAVFLTALFLTAFRRREKKQMIEVSLILATVLVVFNVFYFFNIIPPVPLSLKQIGVYHSIERATNAGSAWFAATYEEPAWYVFWRDTSSAFTYNRGDDAYCFSAVFAPGSLSTAVIHRWEKFNRQTENWETQSTFAFSINGGRAAGYRGYSQETMTPGAWRCNVETKKGQLIGRISFSALEGSGATIATTTL